MHETRTCEFVIVDGGACSLIVYQCAFDLYGLPDLEICLLSIS